MSVTTRLNGYLADAMTRILDGSIDQKMFKAVKRVHGKAAKYMREHGGDAPEAYFTVLRTMLEGKVSAENADVFLKWMLDGGDPAKWAAH